MPEPTEPTETRVLIPLECGITILRIMPGDMLLIRKPHLTNHQRHLIRTSLEPILKKLPFRVPLLVADADVDVALLRPVP